MFSFERARDDHEANNYEVKLQLIPRAQLRLHRRGKFSYYAAASLAVQKKPNVILYKNESPDADNSQKIITK